MLWHSDSTRIGKLTRGYSKNVLWGEAPSRGPTPYPLYTFLTEQVPLSYNFYWHPCLELCNPFNCWKCTVFKIWTNHKTRTFSRLFLSHKMHLLALLNLFTHRNDRFPHPFTCFNNWNPDPFVHLKPEERSLPVQAIIDTHDQANNFLFSTSSARNLSFYGLSVMWIFSWHTHKRVAW